MNKIKANWYHPKYFSASQLVSSQRNILLSRKSTTFRFKQQFKNFSVEVIKVGWNLSYPDEFKQRYSFIREVNLWDGKNLLMFARTIIPKSSLRGKNTKIKQLNNRPLGEILYQDKQLRRSAFKIAKLDKRHYYYPQLKHSSETLWARRSTFYLRNKPILLIEVFTPYLMRIYAET